MEIPKFSNWVHFSDFKTLESVKLPGVYVLAHFNDGVPSDIDVCKSNTVYVGETTKQTICKRLAQFGRSAFFRKNGHSGGWTYSEKYFKGIEQDLIPENLYVAILPIDKSEKESKAFIKLVERLVIWQYFQVNNDYPSCNTA